MLGLLKRLLREGDAVPMPQEESRAQRRREGAGAWQSARKRQPFGKKSKTFHERARNFQRPCLRRSKRAKRHLIPSDGTVQRVQCLVQTQDRKQTECALQVSCQLFSRI
eukprot:1432856-Rhodomonas_salina.1